MKKNTCVHRFFERAKNSSDAPAYYLKKGGSFEAHNWQDYSESVRYFARGLMALGHKEGEALAILAYNRPEWIVSCIGVQAAGGVSAGIYTSCAPNDVKHVITHSESPFLVVENEEKFNKQIKPIAQDMPNLRHIIMMDDADKIDDPRILSFASVLEKGRTHLDKDLAKRIARIKPEQTATLIYTSGTTGRAKAVMLSHRAIDFTVEEAVTGLSVTEKDVLLSYLPLAHVAEQMFSVYAPIYSGMVLYFAESMEKLPENLKECQPTVFFGVPRVYEKMYEKINQRLATVTGPKRHMFEFFAGAAKQYWLSHHAGNSAPFVTNAKYNLGKRILFGKIKAAIGLSRARLCVSGAAPIAPSILEFFLKLDLPIYEVYGQSEDSGPTSFNFPGATKLGTVGKPFPQIKVKIAKDGEILIKGANLFSGYYKDEAATAEALQQGWLLSGDIGEIDSDGFLKITDRKKDLLITAGGKNIAPQNLETMLKQIPLINSAVVIGDRRKYLSALLTPNIETMHEFAKKEGISIEDVHSLVKNSKILEAIQKDIDALNKKLTPVEQIKKFHLLERDFSIEEGELTPTMKLKRKVVNARYEDEINSLYV